MTRTAALVMTRKTALVKTRSKTTTSQLRPPAPGKGLQAPGKDLVTDQATPLPDSRSVSTKSGTTEIGQGRRKGRKEPKPGESHRPLVSGQAMRQRARTGKEKGKGKGKEKGKQDKGEQGKGKGQPGRVGGRTPPPPPPRKRPAAALVEPGDSQNPADEQEYSYYSTEEEGPQAKARIDLVPNPAFLGKSGQGQRLGGKARRKVR